jgi:eukaryotic-like serine/threonine-protein kinase
MGSLFRGALMVAATAIVMLYVEPQAVSGAGFAIRFPLFHRASRDWTQFRLGPDNNAVVAGSLVATWRVETGGQISASPTLGDGILYIGNNNGVLYAIEASSGKTLWTFRTHNPLMSAPLLYNDLVIVGEGDATSMGTSPSEPGKVGQGSSELIALDRKTGTPRWMKPLAGSGMPTPAILNGVLVQHNGAGWVGGFDAVTGRVKFSQHLDSVASMSAILPIGTDQFITAGVGTNAIWRMSAVDGSVLWSSTFDSGVSGIGDCPPVTDGTRIMCDYVAPIAPDKMTEVGRPATERVYAVDLPTGAKRWDVGLESGTLQPRNEAAIPLLVGSLLCVGSSVASEMHALDATTGRMVWRLHTRGEVKGGAVSVDGVVYFGDYGGYLWAVDEQTGAVLGVKNMQTRFNVGSPLVDGMTLVIGSDSGAVVAVPLEAIRDSHDS